jgi:hypothetical protein
MHCFKRLGERVMARTFERQVADLHVRAALLNRFTQLGAPDYGSRGRHGIAYPNIFEACSFPFVIRC